MKGHVPDEHMDQYRKLRSLRWQAYDLKSQLIAAGELDLALDMFPVMAKLRARMLSLRVDLPHQA